MKNYDLQFMIYDLLGREVKQLPITENRLLITRENLPSGIYFYRVSNSQQQIANGKVVIAD